MFSLLSHRFFRPVALFMAVFLSVSVLSYSTPYIYNEDTQRAEAGGPAGGFATEVTQLLNNIELAAIFGETSVSAVANTFSAWADNQAWIKDWFLDGLAWNVAETIRQQIVRSVINWINSGFAGSPMFVQDLGGFLSDIADEIAGEYLRGTELGFLCSPFRIDTQLALNLRYRDSVFSADNRCKITDVLANIENAVGVFDNGWDGLFSLAMNPQNTPYGSLLSAETDMYLRIVDAQNRAVWQYQAGRGFLDKMFCFDVNTPTGSESDCLVGTPAATVEEQLTFSLNGQQMKLITADEFKEVMSALTSQFVTQAFSGSHGLLGYGGSSNPQYTDNTYGPSGNQNIFDAMTDEMNSRDHNLEQPINLSIRDQEEYQSTLNRSIDKINRREAKFNGEGTVKDNFYNTNGAIRTCYSGPTPNNPGFPSELIAAREEARDDLVVSEQALNDLNILLSNYESGAVAATTTAELYLELQSSGNLSSMIDSRTYENEIDGLIADLDRRVEEGMSTCTREFKINVNGQPIEVTGQEESVETEG